MSSLTPELVLFDLDGTLIDTIPDLIKSINELMPELNLPPRDESDIRSWVGNGMDTLVKRALVDNMSADVDDETFTKAYDVYRPIYERNNGLNSAVYAGVKEGLDYLQNKGIELACVTNKQHCYALVVLEKMGIAKYFNLVIGGDSLAEKKPHPLPLQHSADHFGIAHDKTLMVGDSVNDLNAARAAKMPIACVTYGYNHGNNIADANPDYVMDSIAELTTLI